MTSLSLGQTSFIPNVNDNVYTWLLQDDYRALKRIDAHVDVLYRAWAELKYHFAETHARTRTHAQRIRKQYQA